jgi:hypothetical protein
MKDDTGILREPKVKGAAVGSVGATRMTRRTYVGRMKVGGVSRVVADHHVIGTSQGLNERYPR